MFCGICAACAQICSPKLSKPSFPASVSPPQSPSSSPSSSSSLSSSWSYFWAEWTIFSLMHWTKSSCPAISEVTTPMWFQLYLVREWWWWWWWHQWIWKIPLARLGRKWSLSDLLVIPQCSQTVPKVCPVCALSCIDHEWRSQKVSCRPGLKWRTMA